MGIFSHQHSHPARGAELAAAGNKYKSSEIFGNSETRSETRSENRSQYTQGDILSSERSPRGNAFSGHSERSERAQHDWIL